jgi:hypothetical protein
MAADQVYAVAHELYALQPGDFVAARDEAAKRARAAGDRALADEVKRLRRPALAAWAVNVLVRERTDLVLQVLELGEQMRDAQSLLQGDALRDLTRQRRQLVAAVTTQTQTLAAGAGHRLADAAVRQVEETLHAAMADPAAAAAVRSGVLAQPLSSTGLESLADALGVDPSRLPAQSQDSGGPVSLSVVEDRERAEREAKERAAAAAHAVADALETVRRAQATRSERQATVLQVEAEVEELRRTLAEHEHRLDRAADALTEADEELAAAQAAYDEATAALRRLR